MVQFDCALVGRAASIRMPWVRLKLFARRLRAYSIDCEIENPQTRHGLLLQSHQALGEWRVMLTRQLGAVQTVKAAKFTSLLSGLL